MTLPIHSIANDLRTSVQATNGRRILLKAPTGSGKSTVVPSILADALGEGKILVIEPRRMAARLLAGWVAKQRQAQLGQEVGYAVRYDTKYRDDSRIIYLTDGVFQRWLQEQPDLRGVAAVVFDEFHERRLAVDIALGRCLNLQENGRADLRIVVMSATLETAGLAAFLEFPVLLETQGRAFPVDVVYRPLRAPVNDRRGGPPREVPIWERMVATCVEAMSRDDSGHILMFLPGTHEIHKTIQLLETGSTTRGWEVFPLYSALPPVAQEAAITPSSRPKIIVATNVAETSLTIDGVRTVIDSGLARSASFDPRRGINTLLIRKISRAAAEQRAGRAGRTAPGRAYRLWSEADHGKRDAFDAPEVHRLDLSEAALMLKSAGVEDLRGFRWFDAPHEASLLRAEHLLRDLGAFDHSNNLTDLGQHMARLPLEPRPARIILAGIEHGCAAEATFIAASLQSDGVFTKGRGGIGQKDFIDPADRSDFASEWTAFDAARSMDYDGRKCSGLGIHGRTAKEISQAYERLSILVKRMGATWNDVDFKKNHERVSKAMLAAFSDHLAIRYNQGTLACRVVGNRRGKLDEHSSAKQAEAFVAAEITEVEAREIIVHLKRATAIELDWLKELFPGDFHDVRGVGYDESRKRVVLREEKRFRDFLLEVNESDHRVPLDAAAKMLATRVIQGELVLKNWDHSVEQWAARLILLGKYMPELEMPGWTEDDQIDAITQICHGAVSYKEIKDTDVWRVLRDWLSHGQREALQAYCPERIPLPNQQSAKISYQIDGDPMIAVRVSHLFGMWETPRIVSGRVPLRVHVLTPGQKPWQMTQDLKSFWESGYRQMKKEVAGRYPRHPWPDDPKAWFIQNTKTP